MSNTIPLKNCQKVIIVVLTLIPLTFSVACNSKENTDNYEFNISYRIDTFKVDLKRYLHETDKKLDWYSVLSTYPVFESDSLPILLEEFNKKIVGIVDSLSCLPIKDLYKEQFDKTYFQVWYDRHDTGTYKERVLDFINRKETKYGWSTYSIKLEPTIYVSDNFVSVRIEGNWNLDVEAYPPEDYVYCFNALLNENQLLTAKDCFELKQPIDEWKEYLYQKLDAMVTPIFLKKTDSTFSPIKFHKQMEGLFDFYFYEEYGTDYAISLDTEEIQRFFNVKYIELDKTK